MSDIGVGHNSVTAIAVDQLRSIIERVERLEDDKKAITDDIKDVYAEAKGNGYDVKALRTIVRIRKQSPEDRANQEAVLENLHARARDALMRTFRYVRIPEAMDWLSVGWLPHVALAGTHHGEWSILCEWLCECRPVMPRVTL